MKKIKIFFTLAILLILQNCETNPPTTPFDPQQNMGKVFITSNVSEAGIWIDYINTGKFTPDTVEAIVGIHIITLIKENYITKSDSIEVLKDSLVEFTFLLDEVTETGKVYISANVDGAQIFIDLINTGKTTPDTIETTPGIHHIDLLRAFFRPSTQIIDVVKDSLTTSHFILEEIPPSNVILIEDFANVSCIPCVTSNKIIETLTNDTYGHEKLVAIKYPTNFPSPSDPFYLSNPTGCESRMDYYNIFFAPTTIIDGIERPISTDSLSIKSAIDGRLVKDLRFRMFVSDLVVGTNYFATITVKVINGSGIDFSNLVLHTVVTETNIEFSTPPGSNGETEFYDVMRVMLPSNAGESLNGISQTEEVVFQYFTNLQPGWVVSNLNTVSFVQNVSTKEIYQTCSTFE